MRQQSLAGTGFDKFRKRTRREQFLAEMDALVPWAELVVVIAPYYPSDDGCGRPPVGLERMLRLYCLAHGYDLTDPGAEEAFYDIEGMRRFVGIDLGREPVLDETSTCKCRYLLEQHELGTAICHRINAYLADQGIQVPSGTMVDARDPDMHQTRKGNQWYVGMTGHFGVNSDTKPIHSVAVTPANTHDSQVISELLHGHETAVWTDSAYTGQTQAVEGAVPNARDYTHAKGHRHRPLTEQNQAANPEKSRTRAKVEHRIGTIKCVFGFTKLRYRGIDKNTNRLFVASGLANLF